jgi:hypothetical protein
MSFCSGNSLCLFQCMCTCFDDEECNIPSILCNCGHREHVRLIGGEGFLHQYCNSGCPHNCQLKECHNFRMCGQKRPQWVLNCHNSMCSDCAIMIGKIKFLDEKDDCPVCFIKKDVIEISCGHKVCLDCWKNWSETIRQAPVTCPLCRKPIWS